MHALDWGSNLAPRLSLRAWQMGPVFEASFLAGPADFRATRREYNMSRTVLICCFAALLGSCATQNVANIDWEHARLACADVGIAPGSTIFDRCVANLYNSLWAEQSAGER